jgi:Fe2+ transport system protein B
MNEAQFYLIWLAFYVPCCAAMLWIGKKGF